MNKCTFISKRYLKGKKSCLAGSHWLSLIGIIIGVSSLLVILSVMNGMRNVVIQRILASSPEIELRLHAEDDFLSVTQTLDSLAFVKYINPVYEEEFVILNRNETILTKLTGIDLENFKKHNSLLNIFNSNPNSEQVGLISGNNRSDFFIEKSGAFIGYQLSREYGLNIGDRITVLSLNKYEFSSLGKIPLTANFVVQGIYSNQIPELEMNIVYVADTKLQEIANSKLKANKIEIYSDNFFNANNYKKVIQALFPDNNVSSWSDKNTNLYNAQNLEKGVMTFVLSLIIILSSFNLTGSFLKKVSNKKLEIGILSTIGYTKREIRNIFFYQGLLLSFIGVALGVLLAIILLQVQLNYNVVKIPDSGFSNIFPTLPISIQYSDFIIIPILTFIFSILSSIIPVYRVNKLNPIELIRSKH
ncbi:ABC transporter permease [bacterium]|nr:ABC transporter permease [bacterium]